MIPRADNCPIDKEHLLAELISMSADPDNFTSAPESKRIFALPEANASRCPGRNEPPAAPSFGVSSRQSSLAVQEATLGRSFSVFARLVAAMPGLSCGTLGPLAPAMPGRWFNTLPRFTVITRHPA